MASASILADRPELGPSPLEGEGGREAAGWRLARGQDEAVPAEFADRIIDGESPLRVFRAYRGLTQTALAEASGVNRVQIADIEAGRKSGSVETVRKLAGALKVGVEDLI